MLGAMHAASKKEYEESNGSVMLKLDYKHNKTENFRRSTYKMGRFALVSYYFHDGKVCDIDTSGKPQQFKSRREAMKTTIHENPSMGPKAVMVENTPDVLEASSADMPRNQWQVNTLF